MFQESVMILEKHLQAVLRSLREVLPAASWVVHFTGTILFWSM